MLTNDLNQVFFVSLLMTSMTAFANEGLLELTHSYLPFYGYQYSETMRCHQKSPTDYYGDINYDEFPNGSDIMGVHMASKSSKKVTFEFVLKLLTFSGDI